MMWAQDLPFEQVKSRTAGKMDDKDSHPGTPIFSCQMSSQQAT